MSLKRNVPVDPAEYAHLSHKERMIAGYPYIPWDEELQRDSATAQVLLDELNAIDATDTPAKRLVLDRLFSPQCRGRSIIIQNSLNVNFGYNITHGENVYMNFDCMILDGAPVTIGDDCMFGPSVHIYTAQHPLSPMSRKRSNGAINYYQFAFPVKIGNNVWIGGKAVICPGVVIGDNSVIGAGSVVVKDVPANVLVAGNPAKIIRQIDDDTI